MSKTFNRFKKKSLTIAYAIFPEEFLYFLEDIKNKKLIQCSFNPQRNININSIAKAHSNKVNFIIKLNNFEIISGGCEIIKIWNLSSGKCTKELKGHTSLVLCLQKLTKTQIVSGSSDETIKLWDITSGVCLKTLGYLSFVFYIAKISNLQIVSG